MSDQQQYKYMTVDDIKGLDDNIRLDTSHDDKADKGKICSLSAFILSKYVWSFCLAAVNEYITHLQSTSAVDSAVNSMYMPKVIDNIDIIRQPIHVGYDRIFNIIFFKNIFFFDAWLNNQSFEEGLSFIIASAMHDTHINSFNFHHRMNHCHNLNPFTRTLCNKFSNWIAT